MSPSFLVKILEAFLQYNDILNICLCWTLSDPKDSDRHRQMLRMPL